MNNIVMITGGQGLLGSALHDLLREDSFLGVKSLPRNELDIVNVYHVKKAIETWDPFAIVNCAAYTNVDRAEIEREEAFRTNVLGVQTLAREAARSGAYLIHISTDMIFDSSTEDRTEASLPAPVNWYGETKLKGERILVSIEDLKYLIVRTAGLYDSKAERGFPVRMMEYIKTTGNPIRMSTRAIGCPTSVEDLAQILYLILYDVKNRVALSSHCDDNLLHVAGPSLSWAEMAKMILMEVYGKERNISRLYIETDIPPETPPPGRAARASRLVLDCGRLMEWKLSRPRTVRESLLKYGLGEALQRKIPLAFDF